MIAVHQMRRRDDRPRRAVPPWIFRDIWIVCTTGHIPPPPTITEKCQLMRDHFHNLIRFRSERVAVLEFRKRVSWYAKEMNPCRLLRDPMRTINCKADFEEVLARFLEWRLAYDEAVAAGNQEQIEEDERGTRRYVLLDWAWPASLCSETAAKAGIPPSSLTQPPHAKNAAGGSSSKGGEKLCS